jgi:hypothetical protein
VYKVEIACADTLKEYGGQIKFGHGSMIFDRVVPLELRKNIKEMC